MQVIILLLGLAFFLFSGFADETAELQNNWSALQERKIELLPVPKQISFSAAQPLRKLVVSGMETAKFRAVIIEELESRVSELALPLTVSSADTPAPDAYNVILAAWDEKAAEAAVVPDNGDSRFAQAYTLTPTSNGIILRGKGELGLLYAAVTLRFLIIADNGQVVIHPAAVADWPDFASRRFALQFSPLGPLNRGNPDELLATMQASLKWALRNKVNAIAQLPYVPYYSYIRRLNAKAPHYDPKMAALMRQVTDYARANGIRAGRIGNSISIGDANNPADANDPKFKDLLVYNGRHIATWGHLDWHREINTRYAEFCRTAGFDFINHHTVDSGGANDPALWSKRDAETKRLYGDDRVKADTALWTEILTCFKGQDIDFSISQYPYSGQYLSNAGARAALRLSDTATARATAEKYVDSNRDYLRRLDAALPTAIGFCLRESGREEMRAFYDAVPNHQIWLYWETRNSHRDVLALLSPEIAMLKSALHTPRRQDLKLWLADDYDFSAQNKVLFAEYSWNSNFPGSREFSRAELPVGYPQEWLQTLALRAATGLWGERYGQRLVALFADMLSLAYAYDPEGFNANRSSSKLDLPAFLAQNHTALLRAEAAAAAVFAQTNAQPDEQRHFKAGTYPYFVDILRMLKAAVIYSNSNQTNYQLIELAKAGKLSECKTVHQQSSEQLKLMLQNYREAMTALDQAPGKADFSTYGKWSLSGSSFRYVSLLQPDLDSLQKRLDETLGKCESIFAEYNIPAWYRNFNSKYFFKRIGCTTTDTTWQHFFGFATFKLAPDPVEFRLRHDGDALIFSGQIVQPDSQAFTGKAVTYQEWPDGDSACLRIMPPSQDGTQTHYQIAVGNSGGAFVYRFVTDSGGVSRQNPYDLGLLPEVKRTALGWSFELRVPFAALQATLSQGWKVLFEYNRNNEPFSSAFSEGKRFKDTSFWQDLVFAAYPPLPRQIAVFPGEVVLEEKQHTSGSGTMVTFRPALESTFPVHIKNFTARILDASGNEISQPLVLVTDTYVPVCWKAGLPIAKQLETTQPGLSIKLEAVFRDNGNEKRISQQRSYGKIALPGEPTPAGAATLRTPFSHDFQDLLLQKQGALSLQYKPDWDGNEAFFIGPARKTLFHCGPPLAGEILYWKNTLVLNYDRSSRHFNFHINNSRYTIGVHAKADNWDGKSFINVSATWDLTGEQPQLAIYLDGEKISSEPTAWGKLISGSYPPLELQYPFSFGATNSGYQPADGAIGDIRAWRTAAAFVNQAQPDYPKRP